MFDAFYRSGQTGSRVKGLGIGLAVCRRIVESLGGGVSAARRADGGSVFGFWLPLMQVDDEGPDDEPLPVRSAAAGDVEGGLG